MADETDSQIQLEDLLKLKRHEAPASEFWSEFEADFQKRRLRALMDADVGSRSGSWFSGWTKRLALSGSFIAAAACAAFAWVSQPTVVAWFGSPSEGPGQIVRSEGEAPVVASTALSTSDFVKVAETVAMKETEETASFAGLSATFVRNELTAEPPSERYRRVLSSGELRYAAPESSYVADSFTLQRDGFVAAVYRPGGHF